MIKSLIIGIKRASGSTRMVLLLLVANIFFAVPLAIPFFLLFKRTSSATLFAQRMFSDHLDAVWLTDIINEQVSGVSISSLVSEVGLMLLVLGAAYLLATTFFAGGILEVYAAEDRRFTMRKFWAGCGAYFGRFFRLLVISLIFYGVAFVIYGLLVWRISAAESKATVERPGVLETYAAVVVLLLLLAVVGMIFDYAKIGTVTSERRKMWRETFKATRFAFRHFARAFTLYLIIGLVGLTLFILLVWLRGLVHQASMAAVLLAFVLGQLAVASRLWTRLTCYAAELDLYRQLVPAPAPASTQELTVPEVEIPTAETEPELPEVEVAPEAGEAPV